MENSRERGKYAGLGWKAPFLGRSLFSLGSFDRGREAAQSEDEVVVPSNRTSGRTSGGGRHSLQPHQSGGQPESSQQSSEEWQQPTLATSGSYILKRTSEGRRKELKEQSGSLNVYGSPYNSPAPQ